MAKSKTKVAISFTVIILCAYGLTSVLKSRKNFKKGQYYYDKQRTYQNVDPSSLTCTRWAVVAPSDDEWTSEAVRRQARLQNWCLVIVLEGQRVLSTYDTEWYAGRGNREVVYLTREHVKSLSELTALETVIPWSEAGRKMIGYLYAISKGASVIWDFDDYNMLKFWIPGAAPPKAPSLEAVVDLHNNIWTDKVTFREPQGHSWPTYNPYTALHAPSVPSWPRGLPLEDALRDECNNGELKDVEVPSKLIAVLHSLSDRQPDTDVMHQSTMPLPYFFKRTSETKPLLVPPNTFSPYNARATLHFQPAFWAMYLPLTVEGEFGDIWRSYIAQRLFWEVGLRTGFTARPLVVQDRDIRITKDLIQSQVKASNKTRQLISFLGNWQGTADTFVERMDELWTALYKHKFLSSTETKAVRGWIQALKDISYTFPDTKDLTTFFRGYPIGVTWNVPQYNNSGRVRYITGRNSLEYTNEICSRTSKSSLTFWNSDTHYGSRLDMSTYLGSLGHNVYEAVGTRQNFHPSVWSMPGVHLYNRVSAVIKKKFPDWHGMNSQLNESMIRENFEYYKNDSNFQSVDAFYCLFPASMCEMWMPFNKTTMIIPAHRYNMGRCTKEEFNRLNEHLRTLASMKRPKHIMAASSKYDMEYLRHYTGISDVFPLYAHTATYIGDTVYNPSREEILLFLRKWNPTFFWDNRFVTEIKKFKIVDQSKFYSTFSFSNFVKHRAVVYLPYAVMSYKINELYTMGIPLFFPSMKYLQNIKPIGDDRTILAQYYCAQTKFKLKDSDMVAHPNSTHPYSPNLQENVDKESEYYWLQMADYFQWPHITYFDDFKDLEQKLDNANFSRIHELMMLENERRHKQLKNNWCKVFNAIEKDRETPQDYDAAIKKLYGVSKLQVY